MTLYNGADAAFPGAPLPPGTQLLNIYVGDPGAGAPDTPHIWTPGEANAYLENDDQLKFLPTYVHNYADGDPTADADNGCDAIERMGWAPHKPGDENRILWIDCETLVADSYFWQVQQRVVERGFTPGLYGSTYFVVQNRALFGYWFAEPNNHKPSVLTGNQQGIQWQWAAQWDRSVFTRRVWDGAGIGPRT